MNGRRSFHVVVSALLLAVVASAPVGAAENVLSLVPDDAWGFAVVNHLGETNGKIEKLSDRLGKPGPTPLAMFKAAAGIQKGLDDAGDALLVVVPPDEGDEQPQLLLALPVTDYETFVGQFDGDASETISVVQVAGADVLVSHKAGYAVFTATESRDLLEEFVEREPKLEPEVASLGEWLAANDVAAMVLPAGVKMSMDKAVDAVQQGRAMFQVLGANAEAEQAGQLEQVMQMMGAAEQFCAGVKREVAVVALGARVDAAENVFLAGRVRATPDGKFATWTKAFPASKIDYLAGLPAGPFVFAGGGSWAGDGMEALMRWSAQMMKANSAMYGKDLSDEDIKKLSDVSMAAMEGVRTMSMSMAVGGPDDTIYSTLSGVFGVEDATSYLANYRKSIDAWADIVKEGDGLLNMTMEAAEVKVGGADGLKVSVDMSGMFDQPQFAQARPMFEMMLGEGGKLDAYLVAADEKTVVLGYVSEAKVADVVKNLRTGGADLRRDTHVRQTAALLPGDAQMVGYLSPSGAIAMADRFMTMMSEAMGGQMPLVQIPPLAESPPLGGMAKVVPGGIDTESVMPAETLKALGNYIKQFAP